MPVKASDFEWTPERELAAQLLAEDDLSDKEIAERIGYEVSMLYRWKRISVFYERILEIRKKIGLRLERFAICRKPKRMQALNDRWERLQKDTEGKIDALKFRELREMEKQAAQEAGQWIDKVAPTSPDGADEYSGTGTTGNIGTLITRLEDAGRTGKQSATASPGDSQADAAPVDTALRPAGEGVPDGGG